MEPRVGVRWGGIRAEPVKAEECSVAGEESGTGGVVGCLICECACEGVGGGRGDGGRRE